MNDMNYPEIYGIFYPYEPGAAIMDIVEQFGELPLVVLDVQWPDVAIDANTRFVIQYAHHKSRRLRCVSPLVKHILTWEPEGEVWRIASYSLASRPRARNFQQHTAINAWRNAQNAVDVRNVYQHEKGWHVIEVLPNLPVVTAPDEIARYGRRR